MKMRYVLAAAELAISILASSSGVAQPLRAGPCSASGYHQFDFFLGNWLVRDHTGRILGSDFVAKKYGGCVLIEEWSGLTDADEGMAIFGYNPARDRWHADTLVHRRAVLDFNGQKSGDRMVLTGTEFPMSGRVQLHRITWSVKGDGTVEELWQTSTDAGQSWQVYFDGLFDRISE